MIFSTLCYIEKDGAYLMLHRTKKKEDVNKGKWIGVGGKFEKGEAPEECLLREVYEETGLKLLSYRFRGLITFVYNDKEPEYIFTYTADKFEGKLKDGENHGENRGETGGDAGEPGELEPSACDEGDLKWVKKEDILSLNLWEGDRPMLKKLMRGTEIFSIKLTYHDDKLIDIKEFY